MAVTATGIFFIYHLIYAYSNVEKIQKKGHKKQILSMLKNTSKKDMMSTTKSNKTKNENQRFVV